jgi:hypothetical protein
MQTVVTANNRKQQTPQAAVLRQCSRPQNCGFQQLVGLSMVIVGDQFFTVFCDLSLI